MLYPVATHYIHESSDIIKLSTQWVAEQASFGIRIHPKGPST